MDYRLFDDCGDCGLSGFSMIVDYPLFNRDYMLYNRGNGGRCHSAMAQMIASKVFETLQFSKASNRGVIATEEVTANGWRVREC